MNEYISREAVNDIIEDMRNNHFILMCERVNLALLKSKVAEIPTADVQPVEHGRWEDCEIRGSLAMRCSVCGNDSGVLYNYAYCPNCGARMDGDKE